MNDKMIYVSQDGSYGDASGIILLMERDLGPNGRKILNEAYDNGEHLRTWVERIIPSLDTTTYVADQTGMVITQKNQDDFQFFMERGVL